jgi:hypothetical protein
MIESISKEGSMTFPTKAQENSGSFLQQSLERQEAMQKKMLGHSRLRTLAMLLVLAVVVAMAAYAYRFTGTINSALVEMKDSVKTATTNLSNSNPTALMKEMKGMLQTAGGDIEVAYAKINQIDFDKLNRSIDTLEKVTAALGRFFNVQ